MLLLYQLYLNTYLTGMDHSRVFSMETDSLEPAVRRSYDRFMRQYPDARATQILRAYVDLLAANGGKLTADVQSFLGANGIASMLGMQPPVR